MKKMMLLLAIFGMLFVGGLTAAYAQNEDTTAVETLDEPKDTVSIDDMDPVFYDAEATETESSGSGMTYVIIGGVIVVAAGAFFFLRKKKK